MAKTVEEPAYDVPTVIHSIRDIAMFYKVVFLDIWGVIHNGRQVFAGVASCLEYLRSNNISVVLLSNAPRLAAHAQVKLQELGLSPELYDCLYTSGLNTYEKLQTEYRTWGDRIFHIGPERDKNIIDTTFYKQAGSLQDADFILITGTWEDGDSLDSYMILLDTAIEHRLPMVCANADRIVHLGDKAILCAGSIAQAYEEAGGAVYWHGKPDAKMFEAACDRLNILTGVSADKDEMVMIGDSMMTDIKGAADFGIHSILVMSGIHANAPLEAGFYAPYALTPTYLMYKLQ